MGEPQPREPVEERPRKSQQGQGPAVGGLGHRRRRERQDREGSVVQDEPETVEEVRRILLLHARDAP